MFCLKKRCCRYNQNLYDSILYPFHQMFVNFGFLMKKYHMSMELDPRIEPKLCIFFLSEFSHYDILLELVLYTTNKLLQDFTPTAGKTKVRTCIRAWKVFTWGQSNKTFRRLFRLLTALSWPNLCFMGRPFLYLTLVLHQILVFGVKSAWLGL